MLARMAALVDRRRICLLAAAAVVVGCGGGSDTAAPAMEGSTTTMSITSGINGTTYPLSIYLPPASAGNRAMLPIVYALDGEWWFQTLVDIAEQTHARVIVVGIGNQARRAHDYVPPNNCTPDGGGQGAYLNFLTQELVPLMERTVGGDPARRALLGHSHGGSFVYYALFTQAPGTHPFRAYLASDTSIACMPATVSGWEQSYANAHAELPVRLHVSYAGSPTTDNALFAQLIGSRGYQGLSLQTQAYPGTHTGIIPAAFADAVAFAFAGP